jgi:alkyl sulfatase BDS1-like metallo-beta-lactamase superfamily hydrolase
MNFTDLGKQFGLTVENGVLNYGQQIEGADATLTMTKTVLDSVQLKETTVEAALAKGDMKIDGRAEAFREFLGLLDTYPFWFNIVTP